MKKKTLYILILLLILAGIGSYLILKTSEKKDTETGNASQIANPASEYCIEQGNDLTIKTNPDGSQTGYCVSPEDTECEEWAFFRGECIL